jgi:hypothetical protein
VGDVDLWCGDPWCRDHEPRSERDDVGEQVGVRQAEG